MITFTNEETQRIHYPHNDALVITMTIVNHKVH